MAAATFCAWWTTSSMSLGKGDICLLPWIRLQAPQCGYSSLCWIFCWFRVERCCVGPKGLTRISNMAEVCSNNPPWVLSRSAPSSVLSLPLLSSPPPGVLSLLWVVCGSPPHWCWAQHRLVLTDTGQAPALSVADVPCCTFLILSAGQLQELRIVIPIILTAFPNWYSLFKDPVYFCNLLLVALLSFLQSWTHLHLYICTRHFGLAVIEQVTSF